MISDSERRDVARTLRGLDECIDGVPPICTSQEHNALALRAIRAVVGRGDIFHLLADLIDRPTCRDVGGGYTFECSNCGCRLGSILMDSHEGEPAMTVHDEPLYVPHCCPNCGAEVVE